MLTGSVGMIENQIKSWVTKHVCEVSPEYGRCKKIVIKHVNIDKKPIGDVGTINIASDPALAGPELVDKAIVDIADAAQSDADSQKSGVQTYCLYAYYTKDDRYCPRRLFRVSAQEDFDPEAGPSEPP